jgi:hypothetical protein
MAAHPVATPKIFNFCKEKKRPGFLKTSGQLMVLTVSPSEEMEATLVVSRLPDCANQ